MSTGFETVEVMKKRADEARNDGASLGKTEELLMGQQMIIDVLRSRVREKLRAQDIMEAMGFMEMEKIIDVRKEPELEQMLKENDWVQIDLDDEGERLYSYIPRHENIIDRASLLSRIEAQTNGGIPITELEDCYDGVIDDIEDCIVSGQVIAIQHGTNHSISLFARGDNYLVQLQAKASDTFEIMEEDDSTIILQTTESCLPDLRRGDALRVGQRWYRVSSRVNKSKNQPMRAKRPLSVSSNADMHSANVYCDPFDNTQISLQAASMNDDDIQHNISANTFLTRHGISNDIRSLWLETAAAVPTDRIDLQNRLAEVRRSGNTTTNSGATKKRPHIETRWLGADAAREKAQAANEPKKRRINNTRYLRLTNTHLIGTDIGNAIVGSDDRTKHLVSQKVTSTSSKKI
uniref:Uncharacterized protein n=1 Tax=Aureoumbra lagunensis TaxID=44058 RepID=A0A7S3K250_9STRA